MNYYSNDLLWQKGNRARMDVEGTSNPFLVDEDEEEFSVVEPTTPVNNDSLPDRISYEAIAKQLIGDKFILTALELYTELQELGKPIPLLRDYFSNPGNFERTKLSDLQSTSPPISLRKSFVVLAASTCCSCIQPGIHQTFQLCLIKGICCLQCLVKVGGVTQWLENCTCHRLAHVQLSHKSELTSFAAVCIYCVLGHSLTDWKGTRNATYFERISAHHCWFHTIL